MGKGTQPADPVIPPTNSQPRVTCRLSVHMFILLQTLACFLATLQVSFTMLVLFLQRHQQGLVTNHHYPWPAVAASSPVKPCLSSHADTGPCTYDTCTVLGIPANFQIKIIGRPNYRNSIVIFGPTYNSFIDMCSPIYR